VPADDFAEWYRAMYAGLRSALIVSLGERAVAEDALADGLAAAWADWEHVRTMRSPEGWVFAVARNRGRRYLRRRSREEAIGRLLGQERPRWSTSDLPEIDMGLWALVRRLPERQRVAIALRYVEDLSQPQVADRLGIASGTAAALLHQGRRALGRFLEGEDCDVN
jgi:RNA polymerase sigma-70 factor (ECF subfamily)